MKRKAIKLGIWATKEFNSLNYNSVTELEDYRGSNKLILFITQLPDKSPYQQKKLIDKWCQKLPQFDNIESLWLPSRVNQKIFDAVCELKNLKALWIKWSGIKNIEGIKNLQKLEHLHLGSSSKVESIDVLSQMTNLITLKTEQLNKITDFSPISNLVQLEGLGIDGSMWTAQKIDSLEFLKPLENLKYFTMMNSRLETKSFDPILSLTSLVRFNSSWNYPESEFEKLKQLPSLKYGNVETSWKELKAELEKKIRENRW